MTNVGAPRIGNGFDVHALVAGRRLVLGGVTVPFDRGLAGHSDADVLVHAICDAILGAHRCRRHRPTLSGHRRGVQGRRQPRAAAARLADVRASRLVRSAMSMQRSSRRRRGWHRISRRWSPTSPPISDAADRSGQRQGDDDRGSRLRRTRRRHRRDGDGCCCVASRPRAAGASGQRHPRQRSAAFALYAGRSCRRACARCGRRSRGPVPHRSASVRAASPRVNGRFSRSTWSAGMPGPRSQRPARSTSDRACVAISTGSLP